MAPPRGWRDRHRLARVEPAIERLIAEHATSYWGMPYRRSEETDRVVWTIDHEPIVVLRIPARGPFTAIVYEFSLFEPLRKTLRTRHVEFRYATGRDFARF